MNLVGKVLRTTTWRKYFSVVIFLVSLLSSIDCVSGQSKANSVSIQVDTKLKAHKPSPWNACGDNNNPCLPKCCEVNHVLTISSNNKSQVCSRSHQNITLNPKLYSSVTMKSLGKEPINFFHNPMDQCDGNATLYLNHKFCFRVQEDGSLWYRDGIYNWVMISRENYCVDTVRLLDSSRRKSMVDNLKDNQIYGFVTCTPLYEYAYLGEVISTGFGTGFVVGSTFLLLTFLAYAVLWEEQKIQGWIAMSHTATMFCWYFLLGMSLLSDPKLPNRYLRSKLCVTLGVLQHFFALSNFCWLAVISFNLFWGFRTMNAPKPRVKNIGQYLIYGAFGWGMPLLFVLASVILDLLYSYDPCNMVVVPGYGFDICFVSPSALGPYLYYPVAGVMSLNFIFFSVTACKLCEYKRRSTLTRKTLKTKTELFQLIGKLFFLTGFTWILDFATWIHSRLTDDSTGIPWYSGIVNFISVLQVVPICIIYISRPDLLSSLKTKYPGLENILSIVGKYATCACLRCGSCAGEKSTTWYEASSKDERMMKDQIFI